MRLNQQICVQPHTSAVNVTLPAFAAERRRSTAAAPLAASSTIQQQRRCLPSIDISSPQGAQHQTRRTLLSLSIEWTDRRTDGRTLDRFVNPAPHTVWAVSTK